MAAMAAAAAAVGAAGAARAQQSIADYSTVVGPLVRRACATCHRPGQPAPFALATHADLARRRAKVAEVVRDLWRRDQERGLSAGEKRMLAKARQILVGELALAENTDDAKAMTILDEVLAAAS
jgi:hypothetical protein